MASTEIYTGKGANLKLLMTSKHLRKLLEKDNLQIQRALAKNLRKREVPNRTIT